MQSNDSNIAAFPAFPCTSRYVALGAIEDAVSRVSRAIDARESAALVIGPPGTGKSLLCGMIAEQYQSTHQVVLLGETPLDDRDTMLRHLLHHLGVDPRAARDSDPHLALVDYLTDQSRHDEGLILIVDEAQKLSAEVIEAIRMVTNISREGEPRLFALLCGGVKLDETLVDSSLESFTQRAGTRCYLHPMNAEETRYFIQQTISNCGADPESTITDEAIATIHHACSGVPRLINQLISQAIDCAAEADETLITEQFVDRAWAQLQQLPSPMVEEPAMSIESSPIEFGELDDSGSTVQWDDEESGGYGELPTDQPIALEQEPSVAERGGAQRRGAQRRGAERRDAERCSAERRDAERRSAERRDAERRDAERRVEDRGIAERGSSQESRTEDYQTEACESGAGGPDSLLTDNGIALETSSALWVDEPLGESCIENETPAGTLFGQFDHEEEIKIGSGFATRHQEIPAPPANLETLLQQEIVGAGSPIESIASAEPEVIQLPGSGDRSPVADDSDLLVIEDEVAVLPIDGGSADGPEAQPVSVDFQAMLSKMRGGN
jgi:type II secretory pathway predicted ATPase ExeA